MPSADERLAVVETELRGLRDELERQGSEIIARLDGPPWEGSMRARFHNLAGRVTTLEAAGIVLQEAQRERRKALDERDLGARRRRAEWWKVIAALTALVAVVAPYAARLHG